MPATVLRSTGSSPYTTSAITGGSDPEPENREEQHEQTDPGDGLTEVCDQEHRHPNGAARLGDHHTHRHADCGDECERDPER